MGLGYVIPVHPFGKLIVVGILAYTVYEILRIQRSSFSQDTYVERATRLITSVGDLEQADWKAILAVVREQELAKVGFARAAPNTILLLGLLGTVFGLAETVGSLVRPLGNALNSASPQEVFNLLSFTLQQMGTAFSCTIWGIMGALLVSFVSSIKTGRLIAQMSAWDSHIVEQVLPGVLPKNQAAQLQSLQELVAKSQEIVAESRRFLDKIAPVMREAAEQFKEVLSSAGEAMQSSVERLIDATNSMQRQLREVTSGVNAGAQALAKSSEELRQSTESLAQYHHDLRNAHAELLNVFEQARHDLENQIEGQLKQIGQLDENFRRNAQDIVARIHEASERIGESITAFREAGDRFTREGVNIHTQVTTYHQQMEEALDRLFKDHRWAIDEVEKSVRSISYTLKQIAESPVWAQTAGNNGNWGEILKRLDTIAGTMQNMPDKHRETEDTREAARRSMVITQAKNGRPLPDDVTIRGTTPLDSVGGQQTDPIAVDVPPGEVVDNNNICQLGASVEELQQSVKSLQLAVYDLKQGISQLFHHRTYDELSSHIESLLNAMTELTCAVQQLVAQQRNSKPRHTLREGVLTLLNRLLRRGKNGG
jgi:methyl-accepting chemotaxis protein